MSLYPSAGAAIRADLTAVVEEARNRSLTLIGEQACPMIGVDAKSGTYPKVQLAAGALLDNLSTVRTRGGSYNEVSRAWTTDTYDCVDRGLEEPVDDTDVKDMARFFDVEASVARNVLHNMKLDHEVRAAAQIMSATNFGAGTNSAVAYTVANKATVDFPLDVLAAIDRVVAKGEMANTIIMSGQVFNRIKLCALTQSFIRGATKSSDTTMNINAQSVADAFKDSGIERCLVGAAQYNTAKKGQAVSLSSVWGVTYVWVGYLNPGASVVQDAGAASTLVWNAEGGLFVSETYRNESRRSNMVRVRQNTTEKCINGNAGTLITTQYS
jgi:hypothetical protein